MNGHRVPRIRTATAIIVMVVLTSMSAGCMWAPELAKLCRDIEQQIPGASFDKQFAITLGPVSLAFAKLVTNFIPEARQARGYLRDVSKIQVAVYENDGTMEITGVRMPDRLEELNKEGWETAIKVREEDSIVWVMYKIDDDSIREMYVIVLDDSELVMVKARGRLEKLAAHALHEAKDTPGIPAIGDQYGDLRSSIQ